MTLVGSEKDFTVTVPTKNMPRLGDYTGTIEFETGFMDTSTITDIEPGSCGSNSDINIPDSFWTTGNKKVLLIQGSRKTSVSFSSTAYKFKKKGSGTVYTDISKYSNLSYKQFLVDDTVYGVLEYNGTEPLEDVQILVPGVFSKLSKVTLIDCSAD